MGKPTTYNNFGIFINDNQDSLDQDVQNVDANRINVVVYAIVYLPLFLTCFALFEQETQYFP